MQNQDLFENRKSFEIIDPTIKEIYKKYDHVDAGDEWAQKEADTLITIANVSVRLLNHLAILKPELFSSAARDTVSWPSFISQWPFHEVFNQQLLDTLDVGADASFKYPKKGRKSWDTKTLANRVVATYLIEVKEIRMVILRHKRIWETEELNKKEYPNWKSKLMPRDKFINQFHNWQIAASLLPELNKNTRTKWFDVIWIALMETYEKHPEKDEQLRTLGEHRARHSEYIGQQKKATDKTIEANIRDGIKKALKKSFYRIVEAESEDS